MTSIRNKVMLIGNLGKDPEIKTYGSERKKAVFSLATNETYQNASGEKVTETQWHNIVAWGKKVDVIEKYLTKGNEIAVEGKLINRSWKTKEGETKYISEVVVNELLMLKTK